MPLPRWALLSKASPGGCRCTIVRVLWRLRRLSLFKVFDKQSTPGKACWNYRERGIRSYVNVYRIRNDATGYDGTGRDMVNLRTKILDFRGLDSSRILILRGETPRPIGNFQESLSQAILAGIILIGRLGVWHARRELPLSACCRRYIYIYIYIYIYREREREMYIQYVCICVYV